MLMQAVTESHTLPRQMDITGPEGPVEIQIRPDGSVLWIHVEGVTVLRVCRIKEIVIRDERSSNA